MTSSGKDMVKLKSILPSSSAKPCTSTRAQEKRFKDSLSRHQKREASLAYGL